MPENKFEERIENPSSSSTTEKKSEEEMFLDDLVDDAVWEVCFDVHRSAKLGYFFLDDPGKNKNGREEELPIQNTNKKNKEVKLNVLCPHCKDEKDASKLTTHLVSCTSDRRKATNKKITEGASFENDNNLEENSYSGFNRKKSKNKKTKINSQKNPKKGNSVPKSSLDITSNHDDMTYEERITFFNQKCGVVSKRTNKMCMNSQKCSNHTDEQRRDVRNIFYLSDMSDPLTDGQLDVDTVDEGNHVFPYFSQSVHPYLQ